jgi:hypothetical protein
LHLNPTHISFWIAAIINTIVIRSSLKDWQSMKKGVHTCAAQRDSGQQELAVETYRVKTKINNNHDIHKTQS